jgi:hypothetical protein
MNKPHAVRFLLLKHLWLIRAGVPPGRHEEVARSLQVEVESDHYTIRWTDGGRPCLHRIPVDDLSFYRRGDVATEAQKRAELDRPNEVVAAAFARQALGLDVVSPAGATTAGPDRISRSAFGYAALLTTAAAVDPAGWWAYALLAAASLAELHPRLRAFVWPAFTLSALAAGLTTTAAVAGLALAVLTLFDARRRHPLSGAAALLAIAGVAAVAHQAGDGRSSILLALALAPAAFVVVLGRALFGVHRQFFPLVFPVFCLGLIADGHPAGGLVGVVGAALMLVVRVAGTSGRLRRLLPVPIPST